MHRMSIAESYFADEINRTVGGAASKTWLMGEMELGARKSASSEDGSHSSTPRNQLDASGTQGSDLLSRHAETCTAGSLEHFLAAAHSAATEHHCLVRSGRSSRRESQNSTPAASRASSTSPQRVRRLPISSDHLLETHNLIAAETVKEDAGEHDTQSMQKSKLISNDTDLIRSILQAGGQNAGLIFTDAAHSVTVAVAEEGDEGVRSCSASVLNDNQTHPAARSDFHCISDEIFTAGQLDNSVAALSEIQVWP